MAHFFDLSRELRDMIYSYLIKPQLILSSDTPSQPTVSVLNAPFAPLLRISRQFSSEYLSLTSKAITLQIVAPKDNIRDDICLRKVVRSRASLASSIRTVVLYIRINCWQCVPGFPNLEGEQTLCSMRAKRYVQASEAFLRQMRNLREVRFRIGLEGQGGEEPVWPGSSHPRETWDALKELSGVHEGVEEVEVVQCADKGEFKRYCYREEHGLRVLARWGRENGWERGEVLGSAEAEDVGFADDVVV